MAVATIEEASPSNIEVKPLSIHIGAEIEGVDLSRPIPDPTFEKIHAAFLKWKVVFFRGQSLDHDQHRAFARRFGELTVGHAVFGNVEGYPEIYSIAKHRKANRYKGETMVRPWTGWHADITAAINPPAASILRGVTVPPHGGDTQWTNLVAAYNGLSETMRGIVDGLRGIHRFAAPQGVSTTNEYDKILTSRGQVSEHPLVRVHPETGERALYISPVFLKSIVGLNPRESLQILELLWEHAVRPSTERQTTAPLRTGHEHIRSVFPRRWPTCRELNRAYICVRNHQGEGPRRDRVPGRCDSVRRRLLLLAA